MSGGATAAMLEARYGYGPNRGPRRMPARMANRFVTGLPEDDLDDEDFGLDDEEYGVDIPDDVFSTEMANIGTGIGAVGSSVRNLSRYATIGRSVRDDSYGDIGDAAVAEMFGEDGEDAFAEMCRDEGMEVSYDEEGNPVCSGESSTSSTFSTSGFKLPTLPSWALPAAIGTAAAAGAVGLGLALTGKKRRAKRAAREAAESTAPPSFGSMGDTVAFSMFGDPDDDESFGWDFTEDQFDSMFGEDPPPQVTVTPVFGPGPSSVPTTAPTAAVVTRAPPPTWHEYKQGTRDVYRAGRQAVRAQGRLAESGAQRRVAEAEARLAATEGQSLRAGFQAARQVRRAMENLAGSGVQRRATEAEARLAGAQAALPSFPAQYGAYVAAYGCTPSSYFGVYGAVDPISQQISAIQNQALGIVTKFIPLMKRPIVIPQFIILGQRRDKFIDQGASSDSPQASQIEDQAMRLLSNLDQSTAGTLWTLGRQRDNLRRRLAGRPEESVRPPPVLV